MQFDRRARAFGEKRERRGRTVHAAAVAHAIPICPCLLDDFGHFSKDGDRRFGQQLGKRLRARASLCVTERLIKRNGDKFNHLNLSIGRLRRQIDFKDALQL